MDRQSSKKALAILEKGKSGRSDIVFPHFFFPIMETEGPGVPKFDSVHVPTSFSI